MNKRTTGAKKKIRKNTDKILLIKQQAYVRSIYVWILDRPPTNVLPVQGRKVLVAED